MKKLVEWTEISSISKINANKRNHFKLDNKVKYMLLRMMMMMMMMMMIIIIIIIITTKTFIFKCQKYIADR